MTACPAANRAPASGRWVTTVFAAGAAPDESATRVCTWKPAAVSTVSATVTGLPTTLGTSVSGALVAAAELLAVERLAAVESAPATGVTVVGRATEATGWRADVVGVKCRARAIPPATTQMTARTASAGINAPLPARRPRPARYVGAPAPRPLLLGLLLSVVPPSESGVGSAEIRIQRSRGRLANDARARVYSERLADAPGWRPPVGARVSMSADSRGRRRSRAVVLATMLRYNPGAHARTRQESMRA